MDHSILQLIGTSHRNLTFYANISFNVSIQLIEYLFFLFKVAWVRVDTQTILTIHNNVITRNPRISLSRPSSNQWFLHIQRAQESDRGWYMCQINTDPMVHRSGYLEVVGKAGNQTWKSPLISSRPNSPPF